ncbi:MAG: tRNA uridine-5-carboxymethylaminomethyl(34) synthesis GTPase MnmE [Bacteroidetes bacterium]|nr:tRNA uridine-5-carboxymethylaminomethyl(34) synthesis GTPase MnmE [Bacteroidota bacterium]
MLNEGVIVALSTASNRAALHVIRLSGQGCFEMVDKVFVGRKISDIKSNALVYGKICSQNEDIDEVVLSVFKAPHSFTKEDVVEISCHGSPLISQKIIDIMIELGAKPALAGEFTQRAYLNGRFDLAQAEAVADLINAESEQARKIALSQLKGGVSNQIEMIREKLLEFLSLLELELDFGEEDVEFANREQLLERIDSAESYIVKLINSFGSGNAIKKGIPLVIAGKPNAGKSTLLNCLLNEERAIVSDIAGTTRDTIEESFMFNDLLFRLIDTAGIRHDAESVIEQMGIERTLQKIEKAEIVLYMVDAQHIDDSTDEIKAIEKYHDKIIWVLNKSDLLSSEKKIPENDWVRISAKKGEIESLLNRLKELCNTKYLSNDITISNTRHLSALKESLISIQKAKESLKQGLSGEIVVFELKSALEHLGSITGKITNDEVLGSIFSKFCIGK